MKRIIALLATIVVSANLIHSFAADKLWRCINEQGQTVFEMKAKSVSEFSDGLAAVRISEVINNKWVYSYGFIDQKGTTVIPFQYDKIKGKGFVNGRAWVKKRGASCWTLIDKTGKELTAECYEKVGYLFDFNKGMMAVYKNGKMGFVNADGKLVVPCQYTGSTSFEEGLACIAKYDTDLYGFMNLEGEMEIPFKFKQSGVSGFRKDGFSRAGSSSGTVLIDKQGNIVFKTSKGNIQGSGFGLVRIFTKKDRTGWGAVNFNDEWVIDPLYDDLKPFNEKGVSCAVKAGLAGLIDTTGKVLVDFKYDYVYHDPVKDGFYMAVEKTNEPQSLMNTPKQFFDTELNPVDTKDWKFIYSAEGGNMMRYVAADGKTGYINRSFEVIIQASYKKARAFAEGLAWVRVE